MPETLTQVKERPIQFSAPMIRAILEGRKSVTRRIIKPQPVGIRGAWDEDLEAGDVYVSRGIVYRAAESRGRNKRATGELTPTPLPCRYGRAGDRLWVKHPVRVTGRSANGFRIWDEGFPDEGNDRFFYWHEFKHKVPAEGKHFGRGFPRVLSRLTLEITGVRVERVNQISEADAIAEGVEWFEAAAGQFGNIEAGTRIYRNYQLKGDWHRAGLLTAADSFETLWESIHEPQGHHGREAWPWVWVIEFASAAPAASGKDGAR